MLQREQVFMDYNKMKQHVIDELETTIDKHATGNGDKNSNDGDEDVDTDKSPKHCPNKRPKLDVSAFFKKDEESDEEFLLDNKDEDKDEDKDE
jgi:hypothetical protein